MWLCYIDSIDAILCALDSIDQSHIIIDIIAIPFHNIATILLLLCWYMTHCTH
jgi:hypothetical protein